jgi:hypothetical protein
MLTVWPADDQAIVVLVGPHSGKPGDVYDQLLGALGADVPTDEREKPSCATTRAYRQSTRRRRRRSPTPSSGALGGLAGGADLVDELAPRSFASGAVGSRRLLPKLLPDGLKSGRSGRHRSARRLEKPQVRGTFRHGPTSVLTPEIGVQVPLAHRAAQTGCETGDLGGLLPDFYRCARN